MIPESMSLGVRPWLSLVIFFPVRLWERFQERRKRRACAAARNARLLPTCVIENQFHPPTAISIGERSQIGGHLFIFGHGGKIAIGNDCFVGPGTRIWSARSISVGNRVLISHGVNIHDNNSHPLSAVARHRHFSEIFSGGHPKVLDDVEDAPVVIEDDAWIGFNAVILKGVRVGRGAVVGAAAVVTKDVPDFSVVVGNPARTAGTAQP